MDWKRLVENEFARINKRVDHTVVEELAQHAAAAWETARADGAPLDEADAAIRRLIESWCNGTTGPARTERAPLVESAPASTSMFAGLGLDIRHALRLLRRQPGFALVSILMIALAVGATTLVFSVVNGVLLKPLPWSTADRLVRVTETREGSTVPASTVFTNASYLAWQPGATTVDGLGAWNPQMSNVENGSGTEPIPTASVTASLFPLLDAAPAVGSPFDEADERAGNVVLLSYGFWQERFGGAADVVGKVLRIDERSYIVKGVMARGFEFPNKRPRFWLPFRVIPAIEPGSTGRSISTFSALARLRPGSTPAQAAAEAEARVGVHPELDVVLTAVFGSSGTLHVTAKPMLESMAGDVKPALWTMFAAVILLFGAAAGNAANMQLAHAASRRREMAIRAAIGAGVGRLARLVLVETTVLAAIGGAIGVALTFVVMRALPKYLPADFPRLQDIAIDGRVLTASLLLTAMASIAAGALPVLQSKRLNLSGALLEDGTAPVGHGWRTRAARSRLIIITTQVGIAAVLLVGAALLSRSFAALLHADLGYNSSHLLTGRVVAPKGMPAAARTALFTTVIERLRAVGATQAGFTSGLPLTPRESRLGFVMPSMTDPARKNINVHAVIRIVSPDYLPAMGMHLSAGRTFSMADSQTSELVLVVNNTFARQYLPPQPVDVVLPVDVDNRLPDGQHWKVVGVVDDVKHRGATEQAGPQIFVSALQVGAGAPPTEFIVARTAGDPNRMAADFKSIVREASPNAQIDQVMSMEARLLTTLATPRLYALLLGGFAMFALLVAGIGLFGVLSYAVTQRTREIGVRTALGASPRDIVSLIARQGLTVTAIGLTAGLSVAFLSSRVLGRFLFGITTRDTASFAGVAILLTATALVACALPARRAARIDAARALKR